MQLEEALGIVSIVAAGGLIGFTVACERLAHAEENHSSGPRVLVVGLLLLALVWIGWAFRAMGAHARLDEPLMVAIVLLTVPCIFFATEAEALPRRVRRGVPRARWRALLAAPFLPGGGRGVLYYLMLIAILLLGGVVIQAVKRTSPGFVFDFNGSSRVLAFGVFYLIYVLAIPLMFSRWSASPRARLIARCATIVGASLSMLLPALFGFFVGSKQWSEMDHPLNPFYMYRQLEAHRFGPVFVVLFGGAIVLLLANAPRMVRGLKEVGRASRERAQREAAPARAPAISPEDARVLS
jgi:hypothetical protein